MWSHVRPYPGESDVPHPLRLEIARLAAGHKNGSNARPSYPNWQRKRIQNPCSVSSNLTEGTTNYRHHALIPRMNRATVGVLTLMVCASAVAACQTSSGITRISETSSSTATTKAFAASTIPRSTSISPTTSADADDPAKRIRDTFRSLQNPVVAATKDGAGSYEIPVPPQPSASGPAAYIAALCTGGPAVNIALDGAPVPGGGVCGDDPGKPGIIVMLLAVRADPSAPHTIKVQGAAGQRSWVSMAYGQMY